MSHIDRHGFVDRCHAANDRHLALQAVFDELTKEPESVRAGSAEEDCIRVLHLCDVATVVRRCQRREYLLNNLSAIILQGSLKARAHFGPASEIVGDGVNLVVVPCLCWIFRQGGSALIPRRSLSHTAGDTTAPE